MAQNKSVYARSESYQLFRSWVALQQITIGSVSERVWKYYDHGPKEATPLVCIPGASGTADVFFRQMISLCPKGYRVISVQFDAYDTHQAWCKGFDRFLDKIAVNKVHLFGTSLGGYLAQCYAQFRPGRVESMVLNNTFCDTQYFHDNAPCAAMFSIMPDFLLKRILLGNFPSTNLEPEVANSVDFMVEQLELLNQSELAGRLTLNCVLGPIKPGSVTLGQDHITIIDTFDDVALPDNLREEVYKIYPDARVAHLKTGGNFPYLSRADEVNVHIQVHLRRHGLPIQPDDTPTTSKSDFRKSTALKAKTPSPPTTPRSPKLNEPTQAQENPTLVPTPSSPKPANAPSSADFNNANGESKQKSKSTTTLNDNTTTTTTASVYDEL